MTAPRQAAFAAPARPTQAGVGRALRATAGGAGVAQLSAALARAAGRVLDLAAPPALRALAGPPGLVAATPESTLHALLEQVGHAGPRPPAPITETRRGHRPAGPPQPAGRPRSTAPEAAASDGANHRHAVGSSPPYHLPPRTTVDLPRDGGVAREVVARPAGTGQWPRAQDGRGGADQQAPAPATMRGAHPPGGSDVATVPDHGTEPEIGSSQRSDPPLPDADPRAARRDPARTTAAGAAAPQPSVDGPAAASTRASRGSRRRGQLEQLVALAAADDARAAAAGARADDLHGGRAPGATGTEPALSADADRTTIPAVGVLVSDPPRQLEAARDATVAATTALGDPAVLAHLENLLDSLLRREAQRHGLDGDLL